MKKSNFFVFSLRKNLLPMFLVIFLFFLVIFSKHNLNAAKSGLQLWANAIVPSLLPFFIATELLNHTNIIPLIGRYLNPIMRPIFNVPGEGAYAFIMGLISGYPVGAKIVTQFRKDGICTQEEGSRLLAFTNNSGPLFIIGTVGVTLLGDTTTGFLLLGTHILSCITVGMFFGILSRKKGTSKNSYSNICKNKPKVSTSAILSNSIDNAIHTILMIGGFVVLFSVILSILKYSNILDLLVNVLSPFGFLFGLSKEFILGIITGIIELTNGLNKVASISVKAFSTNVIICAFLLGFGGISVLLQVYSIVMDSDLSIKPYIIGKLLQGLFASFYTYLALHYIPIFSLDLPVFSNSASSLSNFGISNSWIPILFLCILMFWSIFSKHHITNN